MVLQESHNYDCLPCSFAMACNVPLKDFLDRLPDGYIITRPGFPPPKCYRGWHYQECLEAALSFGYAGVPFIRMVGIGFNESDATMIVNTKHIDERGVIIYDNHAVAYEDGTIYDSVGKIYRIYNLMYKIIIPIYKVNFDLVNQKPIS